MNDRNNYGSLIMAFLIGGLIGAGAALLMAPQSGDKTRSLIADKSSEIKGRAVGTVEDTRVRAGKAIGDISNQAKDRVSNMVNRGQEVVKEGQEQFNQ